MIKARTSKARDPTAMQALNNLSALKSVKCYDKYGNIFMVYHPQEWIKIIDSALELYKNEYGVRPYATIYHRYAKRYDIAQILTLEHISKRLYQSRRTEFLGILLAFAIQSGLIKLNTIGNRKEEG